MSPYPVQQRINPHANTPDMYATLFGSNQSFLITLPASPELSRSSKYTLLPTPRTLGVPLILQGLFGMRSKIKPRKNYSCIEEGQHYDPSGPYTTKSSMLNSSLPHTGIINLIQLKTCKMLFRLCTASPNCLNTKSSTEEAGAHKKIFP